MAPQNPPVYTESKKVTWFKGETFRFRDRSTSAKWDQIHENLLRARCPSASFEFFKITNQYSVADLEVDDVPGFNLFLVWIYTDTMVPLEDDLERSYVSAFCFAQKYQLPEFEEFLMVSFASIVPSYYGGGRRRDPNDPTVASLIAAATIMNRDSIISEFLIEQFIRSWIWRRAYTKQEFKDLVDEYPQVAKVLFETTGAVMLKDPTNEVAVFAKGAFTLAKPPRDPTGAESNGVSVIVTERPRATASNGLAKKKMGQKRLKPLKEIAKNQAVPEDGVLEPDALEDGEEPDPEPGEEDEAGGSRPERELDDGA